MMNKKELHDLILDDTCLLCPELGIRYNSIHQGLAHKSEPTNNEVDFKGNIATRYFEDKYYARAYALTPYENGILILCNKKTKKYTILVIVEDDGVWFTPDTPYETIYSKSTFIALISEALAIFNSNYNEIIN